MRALSAEHGMANEFRFKDYPNEMKFTPVTDDGRARPVGRADGPVG